MVSWYFIIAMLVNFASTFAYQALSRNEKVSDELVLITTRCIMASYALLFISVARLLLKGNIFYIVISKSIAINCYNSTWNTNKF